MHSYFLIIIVFVLLAPAYVHAEGEANTAYRTLTITSDEAEKAIYEHSKTIKAEADDKAAQAKENDPDKQVEENNTGPGFHHLSVTPDKKDDVDRGDGQADKNAKKDQNKDNDPPPPIVNGPTPITPAKKLKSWAELNDLYAINGAPEHIKRALSPFENATPKIPPQGLIQMASLYETMGDMKNAARYYYGAQLRARFDERRFGARGQVARAQVLRFADALTPRIGPWVTQSSARLNEVLSDVRAWDASTPYDYYPGFGVMPVAAQPDDVRKRNDDPETREATDVMPSESEWPDVLDATRADFFRETGKLAAALQKIGK